MTEHDAMELARRCAQTLFERDQASNGLGMRLLSVAPGAARLGMSVRADMLQGHGTCHGGFIFALADSAFALACNSHDLATVAMGCNIDYIAPAHLGDTLTADCLEQHRGGRTGHYAVRIENQQGRLIALFHGKSYQVRGPVLTPETCHE
ncbi:hydroxyphenylacetyl-CoA thioesterase PaaI [Pseudomonas sp. Au-Pse12]|jgi:acyl-CoA thioesterase|uniref:hydroxyphenylacetyl-CoA thioesterase PaaI n=1 Tax=Pseudomonas sp. Au-Pse12 TaxID=2906459 RepID=UPI001E371F8B|nr:hydroxyphenylacetyl-CoA thioesterase PaaI [Pseudomonas sp. Au-Pse12]MCE4052732.1 hydroxyphenylacetyl-CoA thioesterase PaaI [Pseudomonas sp. Au-Pse12]